MSETRKIYLGELDEADVLIGYLAEGPIPVDLDKAPEKSDAGDLAVVSAKSGITSNLRHAVNNPLTAVLGFTQLLLRREDLPVDVMDKLKKIHEHAQRVRDLLRHVDGTHG